MKQNKNIKKAKDNKDFWKYTTYQFKALKISTQDKGLVNESKFHSDISDILEDVQLERMSESSITRETIRLI